MLSRALCLLAVLLPWGSASADLSIQLGAAWGGVVRSGGATELRVELVSGQAGPVVVELRDHQPPIRITRQLEALRREHVVVPVSPRPFRPLEVEARFGAGPPVRAEFVFKSPGERPLIAIAGGVGDGIADASVIFPANAALPQSSAGYRAIDALVVDDATLERLDPTQAQALRDHLAGCGRLILMSAAPRDVGRDPLLGTAGCGHRFLHQIASAADLPASVQALLLASPTDAPSNATLRELLGAEELPTEAWAPLLAFWLLYALAAPVLIRGAGSRTMALAIPALATTLGLAAWWASPPSGTWVSWSEADSGDPYARTHALVTLVGRGAAEARLGLPLSLGGPEPATAAASLELHYPDAAPGAAAMAMRTQLLSLESARLAGGTVASVPIRVFLMDGRPAVRNLGPQAARPGLLGWRGERYPVPPLAPGATWQVAGEGTAWNTDLGAERILRKRSLSGPPVLLLPFEPSMLADLPADIEHTGWLLLNSI